MKQWDKVILSDGTQGYFYAETEDGLALIFLEKGAVVVKMEDLKVEEEV